MGVPDFSQIQDSNTQDNLTKNNFIQKPSKITMEPSQLEILFCDDNGTTKSINF